MAPISMPALQVDPDLVVLISKLLTVNLVVIPVMAILSYLWSKLALNALAAVDRWLDPSDKAADIRTDGPQ